MRAPSLTRQRYAAALALLVGLLGAGLVAFAVIPASAPPTPPGVSRGGGDVLRNRGVETDHARTRRAGISDRIRGPVLPAAAPVTVTVPRLHIASGLVALGLDDHGAMEVPQDPATAGWYHLGPAPGTLGPAVIAGHVTWNQEPAVFFRLAEVRPGDRVEVARNDGRVAVFRVTRVQRYAKSRFPTRAVFGAIDRAGLRLITCGGKFDSAAHRYRDNVVAFAQLDTTHRTRSRPLP